MTMIAYAFLLSRRLNKREGEKESRARRHSQACQPSGRQSSQPSQGRHQAAARTAAAALR